LALDQPFRRANEPKDRKPYGSTGDKLAPSVMIDETLLELINFLARDSDLPDVRQTPLYS
jgi:hypothetical protein